MFADSNKKKLAFISEQLKNVNLPPNQRRYSPDFLVTSLIWHNSSPSLYNQMLTSMNVIVHSSGYFSSLSKGFSMDKGFSASTINYLKCRSEKLSWQERKRILMVDEVYTAQRIEFSGEKIFGINENEITKALGFYGYAEVLGVVTYFNPTVQAPILVQSVNKSPRVAVHIIDPSNLSVEKSCEISDTTVESSDKNSVDIIASTSNESAKLVT
ncbi:unnamed protein product [Lepeophtheirus salmonis]|uniref:(salmon louse) hypothetical protein n=1 Tax=Lepeophtheirus salmonis TaxID=72036 RepID=A0A7R8CWF6_LEPSM|nr:unnamed protein product [Lepeophtheirus salmonis]CAF2920438.1 unnamed protein product [Lepeophtheirus salmonis]